MGSFAPPVQPVLLDPGSMTSVMGQCFVMSEDVQRCATAHRYSRAVRFGHCHCNIPIFRLRCECRSSLSRTVYQVLLPGGTRAGATSCSGHARPTGHDGSLGAIVGRNVPYIQRWIRSWVHGNLHGSHHETTTTSWNYLPGIARRNSQKMIPEVNESQY